MAIGILSFFTACSSDDSESTSYIELTKNACAQSGGTVSSSGLNNCDYTASVTSTPGGTIASTNTAGKAANDAANASVSQSCSDLASLKNMECKYKNAEAKMSTCFSLGKSGLSTLGAASAAFQSGSYGTMTHESVMGTVVSGLAKTSGGHDCSNELGNLYATYITAANGAFANSSAGCSFLTSYFGKIANLYKGQTSAADKATLYSMMSSMGSSSSCPAQTAMAMMIGYMNDTSSSTASTTSTTTTSGSSAAGLLGLIGAQDRLAMDKEAAAKANGQPPPSSVLSGFKSDLQARKEQEAAELAAKGGLQTRKDKGVTLVF